MGPFIGVLYGLASYAFFFATFLYAIGFVGGLVVPKAIDDGAVVSLGEALVVNVLLLGLFAVQHSVMARPAFKKWWTRFVPASIERSTYVLFATAALALLLWQWRPMPAAIWTVTDPVAVMLIRAVFWLGWVVLLTSTFLINHFELFGLRQVVANMRRSEIPDAAFSTPFFYRFVRHPIYLGFLLAFWATPNMTVGHLLFCVATTAYILIGIQLEEHDLIAMFGERYRVYRTQVGMLLPWPRRQARQRALNEPR